MRAEAWYEAGQIALYNGLEIMGFELGPDFALWNGHYFDKKSIQDPSPEQDEDLELMFGVSREHPLRLISADEQARTKISRAVPYVRFHYRLLAAEHANRAADLLPESSQAFAATLCHGVNWVSWPRYRESQQALYQRYVRHGAYVPWAARFGHHCLQPDFPAARPTWWQPLIDGVKQIRHVLKPYKQVVYGSGLAVTLAGILGAVVWGIRRRLGYFSM